MSYAIGSENDTVFTLNGAPQIRGHVVPFFQTDEVGTRTGKVACRYRESLGNNIPGAGFADVTDIINADTGLAFADLNAFDTFIRDSVLPVSATGGSGSGLAYARTFFIVAAPALDNEKAAGATFTDAWLDGITPALLIVNNQIYSAGEIDYDDATDSIGIDGGAFVVGDVVVVIKAA